MSICGLIDYWLKERRLFELAPALGSPTVRRIIASGAIHDLIAGPWADKESETRCAYLRADFDRFLEGHLIPVASKPYKGKTAYMLRLDPEEEEVWEIRSRDPEPGIRVFGRFADTDIFVALTWELRADLKGPDSREWRDARIQCKTDWANLFPVYQPKSGTSLHDYISTNAVFI